ncbi:MAG: hypothetical protein KBD64_06455 [Gammaproteobacteria bacterium]|nr:hypothetical protein [Gammaproteobacteria bacterium]
MTFRNHMVAAQTAKKSMLEKVQQLSDRIGTGIVIPDDLEHVSESLDSILVSAIAARTALIAAAAPTPALTQLNRAENWECNVERRLIDRQIALLEAARIAIRGYLDKSPSLPSIKDTLCLIRVSFTPTSIERLQAEITAELSEVLPKEAPPAHHSRCSIV